MRYAIINDGVVENVILAQPGFTLPGKTLVPTDTAGPGWTWDGTTFSPPEPPPPPAPRSTAMWRARAIARVTPHGEGTLFDAVLAAIDGLADPTVKAAAAEAWERGTLFDLDGQLVPTLMAALGLTEADVLPLIAEAEALPA